DEVRGVFTQAEKYGGPWQVSAYRPWMQKEYALPVVQALASGGKDGAALDPKQAWELLSDMADSADFDWPGGSKEMFTAWWGPLMTLRRGGGCPPGFTPQRVEEGGWGFLLPPGRGAAPGGGGGGGGLCAV